MEKRKVRLKVINYLNEFGKGDSIKTKFNNLCGKTAQYNVPSELFQKRTARKGRVLISWRDVFYNNLTMEHLETFSGGVVVEFINNDFFDENYKGVKLYEQLKNKLGSDDIVSSMISIRNETGTSSSKVQRLAYDKLIDNTSVIYDGKEVYITEQNYKDYKISRKEGDFEDVMIGNDKIEGFIFVDIKGGQQDKIKSHEGLEEKIFNPACEYANEDVTEDVNLVMAYFALFSIDTSSFDEQQLDKYNNILSLVEECLSNSEYDSEDYKGNLLDYCRNHVSLLYKEGQLVDAIQFDDIHIEHFEITSKGHPNCIDFTHNEAVNKHKYYFDQKKNNILSACRPTNVFWSTHISNMMQQNYTLEEYSDKEIERSKKREEILKKQK